ncbi:hypothetical protein GCM10027416_14320 [Okibacterium endophyticum]
MGAGRVIGILVGTVVILGAGAYVPATLLGPLPAASVVLADPADTAHGAAPVMPAEGGSAITEAPDSSAIAVAGAENALPLAGVAKTITALVILDEHPLAPDAEGVTVPITEDDYLSYLDYEASGFRTVTVYTEDQWTLRGMLQGLLLGSSNNHADALARWAYGSVADYVDAANAWLAENGLDSTTVVDATGLSAESTGTAEDLARLAAIATANDTLMALLSDEVTGLAARRGIENTTAYLPEEGITGISLSYTDAAGICLLFTATIGEGDDAYRFSGAVLRQPDWETLDGAMRALMASAREGVTQEPIIPPGTVVATVESLWGERASAVTAAAPERTRWGWSTPEMTVDIDGITTVSEGSLIGTVSADDGAGTIEIALLAGNSIIDPGPLWRLTHPVPVISAFITSLNE